MITKDSDLSGSFDVFLRPRGIFVIALVLVDKSGNVNSHAVTLDCERNYVNFGYGEDSDGQIVLHFAGPPGEGDRRDTQTVRDVMVQYFKGLKDIVVADVMQVSVRTKAMQARFGQAWRDNGHKAFTFD